MARKSKMHQVESEAGIPIEVIIEQLYEKHGSQTAVARELGIAQGTLSLWLVKLGLKEKLIVIKS